VEGQIAADHIALNSGGSMGSWVGHGHLLATPSFVFNFTFFSQQKNVCDSIRIGLS